MSSNQIWVLREPSKCTSSSRNFWQCLLIFLRLVDGAGAVCITHLGPVVSGMELIFAIDKVDQRRECIVERDGTNVSGLFCTSNADWWSANTKSHSRRWICSINVGEALIQAGYDCKSGHCAR